MRLVVVEVVVVVELALLFMSRFEPYFLIAIFAGQCRIICWIPFFAFAAKAIAF